MKLIVISPEAEDPRELSVLGQLFARGLADYHVRKPGWGREELAAYLRRVSAELHPRLVLHTHHDLGREFAVGGQHDRDQPGRTGVVAGPSRLRSCAVHDLAALRSALSTHDRVLFSPVFPSISKPGRTPDPRVSAADLRAVLALPRRAEAIALGGIDPSRVAACRELGFDGVAVLGAVWQNPRGPVAGLLELQQALLIHAD